METKSFFQIEVKSIDLEQKRIVAIASTGAVDRDGEIISPKAFKTSIAGYMKNPVILAGHAHRLDNGQSPVVGKVVDYRLNGKALEIAVEFATETQLGKDYWYLYSNKYQRAFSVGFLAKKFENKTEVVGGVSQTIRVISDLELYEISCVAVPANPEALSKSRKGKRDFVADKAGRCEPYSAAWLERYEKFMDSDTEQRQKEFSEKEIEEFAAFEKDGEKFAEMLLGGYMEVEPDSDAEFDDGESIGAMVTLRKAVDCTEQAQIRKFGDKALYERYKQYRHAQGLKHAADRERHLERFHPDERKLFDLVEREGIDAAIEQLMGSVEREGEGELISLVTGKG